MTEAEIYALLDEVGDGRRVSPALVEQIEVVYFELFGKKIGRPKCKNRIPDAVIEITLKMRHSKMEINKYMLKRGVVLHFADKGEFYTRINITDKVAIEWLRKYPAQIDKFEKYPEDWQKDIEPKQKKAKKVEDKASE